VITNGRGRDEDCSSPPAQIRTCGFPASGSCLGSNVIGLRGMGYPCSSDPWARCVGTMLRPALCPEHALQLTLPSTGRLPSTASAADVTRYCSRLHRYYAAVRLLTCVHAHRAAVAFMGRSCVPVRTQMRSPRFQRKDVPACMGSSTARGSSSASHCTGRMLLSGQQNGVSTSEFDPFRSSIPSPWSPLRTLRVGPRGQPSHHLGPARLARPYAVKDFHLLSSRQLPGALWSGSNPAGVGTSRACPKYLR
jgi:hypothetical protein